MKPSYKDYYYDGEARAIRCDTIAFLMRKINEWDNYFVDLINDDKAEEAQIVLAQIHVLKKRIDTEVRALCK